MTGAHETKVWIYPDGTVVAVKNHADYSQEVFADFALPWIAKNLGQDEVPDPDSEEGSGWQWNEYAKVAEGWARVNFENTKYRSEFAIDANFPIALAANRSALKLFKNLDEFDTYVIGDRICWSRRDAIKLLSRDRQMNPDKLSG